MTISFLSVTLYQCFYAVARGQKEKQKEVDVSSLEHTNWCCQYHVVVFAPKYRRMEIYGRIKEDIGQLVEKPT